MAGFPFPRGPMSRIGLLLLAAVACPALGQAPPAGHRPTRRFSLVFEAGPTLGGPANGIVAQLRAAGFDDPTTCFFICTGTIPHPARIGPGPSSAVVARLAIGATMAIGAGFGRADLGGAIGFRDDASLGRYVLSDWAAKMAWASLFWTPAPGFRFGAGPGWYRVTNDNSAPGPSFQRLGAVLEAGAELPAGRRFFLSLTARAHLLGGATVENDNLAPASLTPSWRHAALLLGFGLHL
jgi:hypothetical protein